MVRLDSNQGLTARRLAACSPLPASPCTDKPLGRTGGVRTHDGRNASSSSAELHTYVLGPATQKLFGRNVETIEGLREEPEIGSTRPVGPGLLSSAELHTCALGPATRKWFSCC